MCISGSGAFLGVCENGNLQTPCVFIVYASLCSQEAEAAFCSEEVLVWYKPNEKI